MLTSWSFCCVLGRPATIPTSFFTHARQPHLQLRRHRCVALYLSRGDGGIGDYDTLSQQLMLRYLSDLRAGHSVTPPPELRDVLTRWADEECVICLESVDDPVLTPCTHVFCKACIVRRLATSPESGCPTCGNHVPSNDLIPLPKIEKV